MSKYVPIVVSLKFPEKRYALFDYMNCAVSHDTA